MHHLATRLLLATAALLPLLSAMSAQAAEQPITNDPLVVSAAVDPNLMILMDTSGSMRDIVEDGEAAILNGIEHPGYVPGQTYGNCPSTSPYVIENKNDYVEFREYEGESYSERAYFLLYSVESDGDRGDFYAYGLWADSTSSGPKDDEDSFKCFENGAIYGPNVELSENSFGGSYSGDFLNWYFSNHNQTNYAKVPTGSRFRPGTKRRTTVAKDALRNLVADLSDTNVGIAGFNADDENAEFEILLTDIDTNRTDINDAIDRLDSTGGTPLVSAAASIGRYFATGNTATAMSAVQASEQSTFPANKDFSTSASTIDSIFSNTPDYSSATAPTTSPITEACQRNFMFAFTDGEPTGDETYNADIADWNGVDANPTSVTDNGTAGDLDDILRAMFDMDFIPGNGFKNNITSYVIGFAIDTATLKSTDGVAGGTYTTANDTEELNEAISDAINAVSAELGSSGTVTFNSAKLESDTALYSVTFNSGGWIGDVESFSLSSTGEIDENSAWQAQSKLEAFDYADRNIITYNDNSKAGVPFALANLTSSSILADLQEGQNVIAGGTQGSDANVTQLINFISGDTSNEGTESNTFRDRTKLLADIVNSSPAFVGDSNDIWPDFGANNAFGTALKPYSAFRTATESREEVLYVGSNDGMLHGFKADLSATGGNELMAYIPNAISSTETGKGLHNLAAQGFVHRQYVDGAPAVRDAFIKTTAAGDKDWHTVLLSGLGAGGKGIFALDVTNPSVFSDPAANADNVVMWEFSADDDTNLGLTYAQPKIVKLNNGKWGAIFGNGYNNSGDGHAELFIVYIEEGLDGTWSYGTPSVPDDYIRLDTETGSAETPNGLSTATVVDTDNDYIVDRVYAGDLQGNMWVFDISSADAANWGSAFTSGSAPQPLFTAQSGQAITSSPSLTYNPSVDTEVGVNEPNILVLFGTGKYLHTTDISDTAVQSYYAVWDKGVGGLSSANLAPRGLVETAFEGVRRRASTGVDVDYTTQSGWFINLLNDASNLDTVAGSVPAGERVLSRSLLRGDTVFFPTQIPDDAVCAKGGESWLLAADIASGLAASQPSFDANGDNVINAADLGFIGVYQSGLIFGTNILGNREYFMKDDQTDSREINFGGSFREGRFSWFELIQD